MILIMPEFLRQGYIDDLKCYIKQYSLEFDAEDLGGIVDQMDCLGENDLNELFSESFGVYNVLKFNKVKNKYQKQFNDALRIALMVSDYEENLEKAIS